VVLERPPWFREGASQLGEGALKHWEAISLQTKIQFSKSNSRLRRQEHAAEGWDPSMHFCELFSHSFSATLAKGIHHALLRRLDVL
jgi:hypothetical protein